MGSAVAPPPRGRGVADPLKYAPRHMCYLFIYYYTTKVAHILNTHKTTVKTRTHKPIYTTVANQ